VLLEREAELGRLEQLLTDACEGRGRLAVLRGPAGIGKTSLIEAAAARAGERGVTVLRARGRELESGFAFGLARNLFEQYLARQPRERSSRLLGGAAALARPALEPAAPLSQSAPALDSDPAAGIIHGLFWLTVNLADEAPALVAVDDAQWADVSSLRFLNYLAQRIDELRILLLIAIRTGEADVASLADTLASESDAEVMEPSPLGASAVETLIDNEGRLVSSRELIQACLEATGGNPFLLVELLAALGAEGELSPVDLPGAVTRVRPQAIVQSVLLRLSRLPEEFRSLGWAAAVLGGGGSLAHAAAIARIDEARAAQAADALAAAGMLAPGLPLEFVHPLVRTAVYESIPPAQRAVFHQTAADLLLREGAPLDAVAAQLMAASPRGSAQAVGTLRDAAATALARGAPEAAVAWLRRAWLEPPVDPGQRADVLAELGRAEILARDARAVPDLERAYEAAAEPHRRAAIAIDLGRARMMAGQLGEAIDCFERSIAEIEAPGEELSLRLEAELIGAARLDITRRGAAAERLSRVAENVTGQGAAERLVLANVAFEQVVRGEPAGRTAELASRALADGALLAEETSDAPVYYLTIWALALSGALGDALAGIEAAVEDARRRGSALGFTIASCFGSNVLYRMGRVAEAEASARSVLDVSPEQRWALGLPLTVAFLLDALIERGDLAGARTALQESGIAEDIPDFTLFIPLLFSRGKLRLELGERESGLDDLLTCGERARAWGSRNPVFLAWRSHAALALAAAGQLDEAAALNAEDLELASAAESRVAVGIALRTGGLLEGGVAGTEKLRAAVDQHEASEARLEHARSLVDLGAALRRAGTRAEARELLAAGRELAYRCGAAALERRAYEELLAAGSRPRRIMRTGVDALTPSELRVARLAAAGASNTDIAQALFITRKTVEKHLGNVYLKLDVSSRDALPGGLLADELAQAPAA
jgi:DNA-binding CsgD family transcriptional regulator